MKWTEHIKEYADFFLDCLFGADELKEVIITSRCRFVYGLFINEDSSYFLKEPVTKLNSLHRLPLSDIDLKVLLFIYKSQLGEGPPLMSSKRCTIL